MKNNLKAFSAVLAALLVTMSAVSCASDPAETAPQPERHPSATSH